MTFIAVEFVGIGYLCPFCPDQAVIRCVKEADMIKHIKTHHNGTTILISPTVAVEVGLCLCDLCRYAFSMCFFGTVCPICPQLEEIRADQKVGQSNAIELELHTTQEILADATKVNPTLERSTCTSNLCTSIMAPATSNSGYHLPAAVRY